MMGITKRLSNWFIVVVTGLAICGCLSENSPFGESEEEEVTQQAFTVSVKLFDESGQETTTISFGSPGTLQVTVRDASGRPAGNKLLILTTTKGSFPYSADGTVVTNPSGIAEMMIQADEDSGAGEIGVQIGDFTWDDTFAFQIGAPADVELGHFEDGLFYEGVLNSSIDGDGLLAIGASATITADLAILEGAAYKPYDAAIPISFSTRCAGATLSEPVYRGSGRTSVTYAAGACNETGDTITAAADLAGASMTAQTPINLATPDIGSIEFISADPTHIALLGTADPDRPSTSKVTFRVKDQTGKPVPGASVNFRLSTTKGGLSISPPSSETDKDGLALVRVTAGTVPTSVRVRATVDLGGTTIFAQSSNLVVSTGLPDQNSFSISVEVKSPEAWDYDGVTVEVMASAADHFNNPVPDGTAIYFTTEGGLIEPSCTTQNGFCSVTWRSQNPRPDGTENTNTREELIDRGGRVTVVATAIGEESFVDINANGRFDPSIDIIEQDLSEAFLDDNENGLHDLNEVFFDYNEDGLFTAADGLYNGTLCGAEAGCSSELVEVRASVVIVMSSKDPRPIDPDIVNDLGGFTLLPETVEFRSENDVREVDLYLEDFNKNSMPAGSTIEITVPDNATLAGPNTLTLPDSTEPYAFTLVISAKPGVEGGTVGVLRATVTTPLGTTTYSNPVTVVSAD